MRRLRFFPVILFAVIGLCPTSALAEEWRGAWIWCSGDPSPKNFYLYCRKTFDVGGEIVSATMRMTADSRYILYVNGTMVNRGPIRCDPRWQSYDAWDIAPYLRDGANVIAVLVHHYGESTFSYIHGRGGFILDGVVHPADGSVIDIISDDSWKVYPATAWARDIPRMNMQLGFSEIFDARRHPATWNRIGFDDSHWEAAVVIGPHPQEPWPRLVARDIPAAAEELISPKKLVSIGNVTKGDGRFHFDFAALISPSDWGVAYAYTQVYSDTDRELELVAGSDDGLHVWVSGQPVIERNVTRTASPNQDRATVTLRSGWTPLLAKVTQREKDWELHLRFDGEEAERLRFSSTQDQGQQRPVWHIVGPFENEANVGFEVVYPPEVSVDLSATYDGKGEERITWQRYEILDETQHPAIRMSRAKILPRQQGDVISLDKILTAEGEARIQAAENMGISIIVDFGREVFGYPELDIAFAREGAQIDIGYGEVLTEDNRVDPYASKILYADRYICRAGPQTFRTFDKRAFRYLRLDIFNTQDYLRLSSVKLNFSTYPVEPRGSFSSSDETLDSIWRIGAYTVQLNMDDAYTDCPWRERAMRWGDARIEMLCNFYAFGDIALGRRGMRLISQSQTEDGRTYGIYPTEWDGGFLPDYMLVWIMTIWDDYYWTGDDSMIGELFPGVIEALSWFSGHVNQRGVLADVPGWVFIDWADMDKSGECAALNAFYYKALRDAAAMAEILGDSSARKDLEKQAKRLKKAFSSRFWDKKLSVFRDARQGDEISETISQQTNALAVLFGLAREKSVRDIMSFVANPENEVVEVGSPYFSFYLLEALCAAGRHSQAYDYVRQRWGDMLNAGATTWWETWDQQPSYCHGRSSAPTYFFPAHVVGLRPTSPGWKTAVLEPNLHDLKEASAIVPTPLGDISAKVTRRSGGYWMGVDLTCPEDCQVTVSFPLTQVEKPRVLINGTREIPENVERAGERDGRLLYRVTGPAKLHLGLQNVPR